MAQPMRCVKLTFPPRVRAMWLLITIRLSIMSFAGTVRTLVAVGTVSDSSMLAASVLVMPRRTVTWSSSVEDSPVDGTTLGASSVFAESTAGLFDGFRFDATGRLWTSAADGIHVYHPDGTLIGKVLVPEIVANLCFGGPKRNRLFICGTTSLYSLMTHTSGAAA